jgi:hypothetical protein
MYSVRGKMVELRTMLPGCRYAPEHAVQTFGHTVSGNIAGMCLCRHTATSPLSCEHNINSV